MENLTLQLSGKRTSGFRDDALAIADQVGSFRTFGIASRCILGFHKPPPRKNSAPVSANRREGIRCSSADSSSAYNCAG